MSKKIGDNLPTFAPEYIRPGDARQMFGISRPKIYDLEKRGKIRSISLAEGKQERATRLISVASIREYLGSLQSDAPSDLVIER